MKQNSESIKDVLARCFLSVATEVEGIEYLLTNDEGIGIMPSHGVVALKGKAKQGKSQGMSILIAAALGDDTFGLTATNENNKVVYVDTEMPMEYTITLGRRVHNMMGWQEREPNPCFAFYNCQTESHETRLDMLKEILEEHHPNLLAIDGIVDLSSDINSSTEAPIILRHLQKLCKDFGCCILAGIHENKQSNDMRGHLGTWLLNKVDDVFQVQKDKETATFTFTHEVSRGQTIEKFAWKRDGEILTPLGYIPKRKSRKKLFEEILVPGEKVTWQVLREKVMLHEKVKTTAAEKRINDGLEEKLIIKDEKGVYQLNPATPQPRNPTQPHF